MKYSTCQIKKDFIDEYFDINTLYKEKIICSKTDYGVIEANILSMLNLASIFDYKDLVHSPLFSSTKRNSQIKMQNLWLAFAQQEITNIENPYEYDRAKLIDSIPLLKKLCMDEDKGLLEAFVILFRCGLTTIFQSSFPKIGVRGATYITNNRPYIVLSNYGDKYPTLWFSLLHEIYHVLYDFEAINKEYSYHLSGVEMLSNEDNADEFARTYFLPVNKAEEIFQYIDNPIIVKQYADSLKIHISIIYVWYCHNNNDKWGRYTQFIPNTKLATKNINNKLKTLMSNHFTQTDDALEALLINNFKK